MDYNFDFTTRGLTLREKYAVVDNVPLIPIGTECYGISLHLTNPRKFIVDEDNAKVITMFWNDYYFLSEADANDRIRTSHSDIDMWKNYYQYMDDIIKTPSRPTSKMNDSEKELNELKEQVNQLQQEVIRLKNGKPVLNIVGSMNNQAELDFIFPYYSTYRDDKWKRSSAADLVHLRKLAMSAVDKVDKDNVFREQKVKELSKEEMILVSECADELVKVVAKYKKQYLESIGRHDIVEAFHM